MTRRTGRSSKEARRASSAVVKALAAEASRVLPPQRRTEVANEIGDVLIYLLRLGRVLDIDVIAAAAGKLAQNREKYPVDKARGRATKYVDFD